MKVVHVLAFVFLAIWLIVTGLVGLAGITLSSVIAVIMNLLALVSGILFLITVGKCWCCERCENEHKM